MNTVDLDRLLQQSLADLHVQSAEKTALTEWATRYARDEAVRAVARSRAFAVAQSAVSGEALQVIEWLEDVIKVFARPAARVTLETAGAFFSPGSTCIEEVLRQINTARQTCDVCVFTITDDRIADAILRAHTRGVKVRVVTDDEKSHDLGSDIDRLKAAGIPCKMDVGNAAHMHHKFALFDAKRLMTGSFNWTRSASEQNEESLLTTPDPVLVTAFAGQFERLWAQMPDV